MNIIIIIIDKRPKDTI